MGTKQLIILLIGCLIGAACTNDDPKPSSENEEKVPVSVRLILDHSAVSRADGTDGWKYDEFFPGITDNERKVSNILLVVFKNAVLEEYNYFDEGDFTKNSDSSIELGDEDNDLIDLEPGPHYFYAILNIPYDLIDQVIPILQSQEGRLTREVFERQIIEKSLDYLTGEEEQFVMTNVTTPTLQAVYSKEQIRNNNLLSNNIQINVGRVVGKISFAYVASEVQTGELHGHLTDINYQIHNNPAQMYLMPVIENNILLTPHYNKTSYPTNYFTPSVKDVTIEDYPWLRATTKYIINNSSSKEEFDYGYCMENHNRFPLKSNSTMLLIRAKFNPEIWLNADGTKGTSSSDGTFYRIGEYNHNDVLYAYLQGYYNEYPTEALIALGTSATGRYKVVKYEEGITYYGFWLNNNNSYQVKRNSYYKVAITHLHGAGEPGPGNVIDPDIDPDNEPTWGRIAIYAVGWEEENKIITIGEEPESTDTDVTPDRKDWNNNDQEEKLKEGNNNKFN